MPKAVIFSLIRMIPAGLVLVGLLFAPLAAVKADAAPKKKADSAPNPYYTSPLIKAPSMKPAKIKAASKTGACPFGYTAVKEYNRTRCVSCPALYEYTLYKGRKRCVKCELGYSLKVYKGRERCLQCPAGSISIKVKGRERCMTCPKGYRAVESNGKVTCKKSLF